MPNSTGTHDHNFGAIEAAVRETERGRAFLADYAKRVRHSDTLTMLAMIARLERWCQEQSARLAELDGRGQQGSGVMGGAVLTQPGVSARAPMPPLSADIDAASSEALAGHIRDDGSNDAAHTIDEAGREILGGDQQRAAIDRIENLSNTLNDLDKRVSDLTSRHRAGPSREPPVNGHAVLDQQTAHSHLSASGLAPFFPDSANKRKHVPEAEVLGGIADALRPNS